MTVEERVRDALEQCDQETLDNLVFELVLAERVDADRLQEILHEQIVLAPESVREWWHGGCEYEECQVDSKASQVEMGLLRFKVGDREEDYGWTGPWPPPERLARVSGQVVEDVAICEMAELEDRREMLLAEGMVITEYRRDTVASLVDEAFHGAAVYVIDKAL